MVFSPLLSGLMTALSSPGLTWFDTVVLLHILLGGVGILLLCRDMELGVAAALMGALVFMFGGVAASRLQHTMLILAYGYLPLAFFYLKRCIDGPGWGNVVLFGLFGGILTLHEVQVAYLGCLVMALYACVRLFSEGVKTVKTFPFGRLALGGLIALIIAAPQLLATLSFLPFSNRPEISFSAATQHSFSFSVFLTLFTPNIFNTLTPNVAYSGPADITETFLFIGFPAIAAFVWAGVFRKQIFSKDAIFFTALLVLSALYSLGGSTPFFKLIYTVLPGVKLFRRPPDGAFILNFSLAILAARSFHFAQTAAPVQPWPHRARVLVVFLLVLLVLCIAATVRLSQNTLYSTHLVGALTTFSLCVFGIILLERTRPRLRKNILAALLVAVLCLDVHLHCLPNRTNSAPFAEYAWIEDLRDGRFSFFTQLKKRLDLQGQMGGPYRLEFEQAGLLDSNIPSVMQLQTTQGYNPLLYGPYAAAMGAQDNYFAPRKYTPLFPGFDSPLLDMLGVRYVLSGQDITNIDPRVPPGTFRLAADGDLKAWENPDVLPRILLLRRARYHPSPDMLFRSGYPPDVNFRTTVLLHTWPKSLSKVSPGTELRLVGEGASGASLELYENTLVRIKTHAPGQRFLLLNDLYYPAWKVFIDGAPSQLLKANALFRAVLIPAGEHTVEFRFRPYALQWLLHSIFSTTPSHE